MRPLALCLLALSCARGPVDGGTREPAAAPMEVAIPRAEVADAAVATAPADAGRVGPERLLSPPVASGAAADWWRGYDTDAGAFVAPKGAFAVVHQSDGDAQMRALSSKAASCQRERGRSSVRISVEPRDGGPPDLRVLDREGRSEVVDCLLARARAEGPWGKLYEPVIVEVFVFVR